MSNLTKSQIQNIAQQFTYQELLTAAKRGNRKKFTEIIAKKKQLKPCNVINSAGMTPLHLAVANHHLDIVGAILENTELSNVWLSQRDHENNTALHTACAISLVPHNTEEIRNANNEIIKLLIEKNPNSLTDTNHNTQTPLHLIAAHGRRYQEKDALSILLNAHAKNNFSLIQKDINGNTPLHLACMHGHIETAKVLIKSGADITATNHQTKTPTQMLIKHYQNIGFFGSLFEGIGESACPPEAFLGPMTRALTPLSTSLQLNALGMIALTAGSVFIIPTAMLFIISAYQERRIKFNELVQETAVINLEQEVISHVKTQLLTVRKVLEKINKHLEKLEKGSKSYAPIYETQQMQIWNDMLNNCSKITNALHPYKTQVHHITEKYGQGHQQNQAIYNKTKNLDSHKDLLIPKDKRLAATIGIGKALGWSAAAFSIIGFFKSALLLTLGIAALTSPIGLAISAMSLLLCFTLGVIIARASYNSTKIEIANIRFNHLSAKVALQNEISDTKSKSISNLSDEISTLQQRITDTREKLTKHEQKSTTEVKHLSQQAEQPLHRLACT